MHKYTIATRSELLKMLEMPAGEDPNIARLDNALHAMNLMRLDACFPLGEKTLLITTEADRIEDYRLVLPLLATRRIMHRIALIGEFEPRPMKVNDLAEIDRELLMLQEDHIEDIDVHPVHRVYTFDRANLVSAVRSNLPDTGQVSHLTMWTAEHLTGISVDELKPPSAQLVTVMTEGIGGLVEQGLGLDDATLIYWLDANPEAGMADIENLGQYLGIENAAERVGQILSQHA